MDILQIALLGVAGTLLAIQFKGGKTEYGIYICAGISLLIFFAVLDRIAAVVARLDEITAYIDLAPAYIEMLLKMLGITFVAEFSSALCGMQAIRPSPSRSKCLPSWRFSCWACRWCSRCWS